MRIPIPLLFILFPFTLLAQSASDSITHSEEYNFFDNERFIDAYGFVFQTQAEQKSMLKLDLTGILLRPPFIGNGGFSFFPSFTIAYEHKVGKAFSINSELYTSFSWSKNQYNGEKTYAFYSLGIGVEPRWYYKLKKRIQNKSSANNLSGNYLSLDVSVSKTLGNLHDYESESYSIGIRYGIQRRIFNRGFIDLQIGPHIYGSRSYRTTGEVTTINRNKGWSFFSRVALGWVLNANTDDELANRKCEAFQCFEERKRLFKFDLLGLLNISGSDTNLPRINGKLSAAYERKFADSWSISTELIWNYSLESNLITLEKRQEFHTGINLSVTPRFYYNLRKRIAMGKSAKNLSANYIGLQIRTSNLIALSSVPTQLDTGNPISPLILTGGGEIVIGQPIFLNQMFGPNEVSVGVPRTIQFYVAPVWGIQRRIFKYGYIDFALGLRALSFNWVTKEMLMGEEKRFDVIPNSGFASTRSLVFSPFAQLKIGLAF